MPRVSVIIPTYNAAKYVRRAIDSVLAQTFTDYEIVVADDGSTDDTREMVGQYGSRINYVYQTNKGPSAARNLALSKASGEFIAYLDADDLWYSHKLATQVAFLETHRECDFVHSDCAIIDESDRVLFRRFNHEPPRVVPHGACLMDLLRRCHIQIPTVMERSTCLQKVGQFDERIKGVEDYGRWIRLAMEGCVLGYIDEPLVMYRRTSGSVSSNERRMTEAFILLFETLVHESTLPARCGNEAAELVRSQLYLFQRHLAYLERADGDLGAARQRILGLIRGSPLRSELYWDFLKSFTPPAMAAKLRRLYT